jgi:hypothetical protein
MKGYFLAFSKYIKIFLQLRKKTSLEYFAWGMVWNPFCVFNLNLFQVKNTKIAANCRPSGEEERQSQLQGHAQITSTLAEFIKIRNSRLTSQEGFIKLPFCMVM